MEESDHDKDTGPRELPREKSLGPAGPWQERREMERKAVVLVPCVGWLVGGWEGPF